VKTPRAPLALAGLVAGAMLVRLWVVHQFKAPQVLCDEFIYGGIARSFADSGHLLLRGEPSVKSLYPVLIAPAWLFSSTARSYELAKAINVVLMTLVAVPVYLWARRLVSPWYALLAAALVLLIPSFHFAGLLMTESGHLPATGERIEVAHWRFEVVDLDGKRIDKVLAVPAPRVEHEVAEGAGAAR
jgi:hypothetical protein